MSRSNQRVLDLFCGAGGLTLGLQRAGHDVIAGVDSDDVAIETYDDYFDHRAIQCDLASVSPEMFARQYGITPDDVQGIGGGPPCQGFSEANLAKDPDDVRNNLVFRFAEYVEYYQPRWFVMENVTGIESLDDGQTVDELYDVFGEYGYEVAHRTLNAFDYGVPQRRERVFFIGVRSDVGVSPQFPEPHEQHRGFADVVDYVDPDDYQSSAGGVTHQVRGEWKLRRCHEPSYTITGTQYPYVIDGDFEPDPSLSGVGEVDVARTMTRGEVRAAQTMDEIEIQTPRKAEALTYIGNAVPPRLAEAVGEVLP